MEDGSGAENTRPPRESIRGACAPATWKRESERHENAAVKRQTQAESWSARRYAHVRTTASASTRARLEAALRRKWHTLGPKMRTAMLDSGLNAGDDAWGGSTTRFAREWVPAGKAAEVLARIAERAGIGGDALKRARAHWEERAAEGRAGMD